MTLGERCAGVARRSARRCAWAARPGDVRRRSAWSVFFFLTNACKSLLWFGSRASVGEDQVLGFGPFIVHDLYCVMGLQFGFQLLESVLGCGDGYVGAIVV